MLKVSLIGTGTATGTSCILDNGKGIIAIDMGMKKKYWVEEAKAHGYEMEKIDWTFVTHAHGDHVNTSLNYFIALHGTEKVVTTKVVSNDISRKGNISRFKLNEVINIEVGESFEVEGFVIYPQQMVHVGLGKSRIYDCVGYKIFDTVNEKWIMFATDTSTLKHIQVPNKGFDLLLLEDNYDHDWLWAMFDQLNQTYSDSAKQTRSQDHLSSQKLAEWLYENNHNDAEVIPLHESSRNKKPGTVQLVNNKYIKTYWADSATATEKRNDE